MTAQQHAGRYAEAALHNDGSLAKGINVAVYAAGTLVPATLYVDRARSAPAANPVATDSTTGMLAFYCDPGLYDLAGPGISLTSVPVGVDAADSAPLDTDSRIPYANLPVGTTSSTVAAGNDSRITGAAQKSANLSDLASASTARTSLGLGTAATQASSAFQPADSGLTAIAALTPANNDLVQRKAGAWTNRTPAQVKTDLALTVADTPWTVVSKTTTYTGASGEFVLADATGGAFTVTPPSPASGAHFAVKKTDSSANAITIGATVDGTVNPTLAFQHGSMELVGDGSVWRRVVRPSLGALVDYPATSDARYLPSSDGSPSAGTVQAQRWVTSADQVSLLAHSTPAPFAPVAAGGVAPRAVVVDPAQRIQSLLGYGAAITDSAAYCLMTYLTSGQRAALLAELFSPSQCGWSTVRIGLGATDFQSDSLYSYDVMPVATAVDPLLAGFDATRDTTRVIPILRQILAINPRVRVFASMWNYPAWPFNFGYKGSNLDPRWSTEYANYLVQAVQFYASHGIEIFALSPFNEPFLGSQMTPSMIAALIGGYIGPAFTAANIRTKILIGDDSWPYADLTGQILADSTAGPYCAVGWHGYSGAPTAQDLIARQYPNAEQYFVEMRTMLAENWATSMGIMAGDLAVGAQRNGARAVTLWNLALDESGNPSTNNTGRRGVITIPSDSSGNIVRNAEYYVLSHLSKWIRPGASRCASTTFAVGKSGTDLETFAAVNPDGSVALFAYNPTGAAIQAHIVDARTGQGFPATIAAGEVSTFAWGSATYASPAGTAATLSVPAAPVLTATAHAGRISLSWTAPSSPTAPIGEYALYRGSTTGTETAYRRFAATTTAWDDVTNAAGTFYYKLSAINVAGESALSSEVSASATAVSTPPAPTLASAIAGYSQVTVSWTLDLTNGPPTRVELYRSGSSGTLGSLLVALPSTATSYIDKGIPSAIAAAPSNGTTYWYTVIAVNGSGSSAQSNQLSATPARPANPSVDTTSFGGGGWQNISTIQWVQNVPTTDLRTMLVVALAVSGSPLPTAVTYAGVTMTQVAVVSSGGGTQRTVGLWTLVAPASGNHEVAVTLDSVASANLCGGSMVLTDVAQTSSLGTAGTTSQTSSTSASTTTTGGSTGDLVVMAVAARQQPTAGAGQTARVNASKSTTFLLLSTQAGGTGTITSQATMAGADTISLAAVAVHRA